MGEQITCSIGIAANRLLAKIACKVDKPNGITIWHPSDMPAPLVARPLSDTDAGLTLTGHQLHQPAFYLGSALHPLSER